MSGIAGMYRLDGRSVDPMDLTRMTEAMAHRGPDGADHWRDGSVGLGHLMLHTTPESLHATLPLTDRSGHFTITADARIDNRKELIGRLGVNGKPTGEITDSELILAAYKKWGEDCPDKLLGAFAFAIWDGRKQTLFCARDHFGIKPFYCYYQSGQLFAFSSEIRALLRLCEVSTEINDSRVADYLADHVDSERYTFYRDVSRLAPAHNMWVSSSSMIEKKYWKIEEAPQHTFSNDEECEEAFRETFFESVRCRTRCVGPLSSLLSGGLDSSAVCSAAYRISEARNRGTLHTISSIYKGIPECNEKPYIDRLLRSIPDAKPHFLSGSKERHVWSYQRTVDVFSQPFNAYHIGSSWQQHKYVQDRLGGRVLLCGHGGDEVVSHGAERLAELANDGRWFTLAREIAGITRVYNNRSFRSVYWSYAKKSRLMALFGESRLFRMVQHLLYLAKSSLRPYFYSKEERRKSGADIFDKSFLKKINLNDAVKRRDEESRKGLVTARERHMRNIVGGFISHGFETLDSVSSHFEQEKRFPFWDKRLVSLCLSIPPDQKLRDGWGRSVMRRALSNVLPDEIKYRYEKVDFRPNLLRSFSIERPKVEETIRQANSGSCMSCLDKEELENTLQSITRGIDIRPFRIKNLIRGVILDYWQSERHSQKLWVSSVAS